MTLKNIPGPEAPGMQIAGFAHSSAVAVTLQVPMVGMEEKSMVIVTVAEAPGNIKAMSDWANSWLPSGSVAVRNTAP